MAASAPMDVVFDATDQNFDADVLQASLSVPIVLDFWADWCGPCKALGPILEKLANEYGGAFRLGKINVDQERQLAAAFQIRSIPTVMLVKDGKPVDGFSGALPEGQVREFLGRHVTPSLAGVDQPAPHEAGSPADAPVVKRTVDELRALATADPEDGALRLELVRALLDDGQLDAAEAELGNVPKPEDGSDGTAPLKARLGVCRELAGAADVQALQVRVDGDADDWEARRLLALHQVLGDDPEAGLEQLLLVLGKASGNDHDLAKQGLLSAFELLDDRALTGSYRRRMASLLF